MAHAFKACLGASLGTLAGCSSGGASASDAGCVASQGQAIVNGTGQETYLEVPASQVLAIVQVVDSMSLPANGGPCAAAPLWQPSGWSPQAIALPSRIRR